MKLAIANHVRVVASKAVDKWNANATTAWQEVPESERKTLKKYGNMLLKKMKDEPFPEKDKEILTRHVKGFIKFLNKL